tara:strand:- start:2369 stop:3307 length:939 start_codon:yes stop_codon:yes gene_type:complete
LTSKYSLSELAISSLLLLAVVVLCIGYLSQNLLANQPKVLLINESTSYSRDDLRGQLNLFAAMDPNPTSSGSIEGFLDFLIELEALRLAGLEKYGAPSESEIQSAIVERFGLSLNQSPPEFALSYAELLSNQSVTKIELELVISGLLYRDKLLGDIRNEIPATSLGYRVDAVFDSPRRVELLLTAIESGKVFPVASDELEMKIVSASASGEFWVSDIELQYRFNDEIVAWIELAEEGEVSEAFSLEAANGNQGIYRVSLIREIDLSEESISFLAGKRFEEFLEKSKAMMFVEKKLSLEDRNWLISETALQLR